MKRVNKMKKEIAYQIASFAGVGYAPKASGTFGSLAALPLVFILAYWGGFWAVLFAAILVTWTGTVATQEVLKYTKHDPSLVVIDEVAGMLTTFLLVAPYLERQFNLRVCFIYAGGFVLFRFFDILKPGPVGWADKKIENAWGVMLDDIFAGIFAAIIMFVFAFVL